MRKEVKNQWIIMTVLLALSTVFGLAGFLVGRSAYGKTVSDF